MLSGAIWALFLSILIQNGLYKITVDPILGGGGRACCAPPPPGSDGAYDNYLGLGVKTQIILCQIK